MPPLPKIALQPQHISHYIENVKTNSFLLNANNLSLPLTVNYEEYDNAHVCSPYARYILLAKKEIGSLDSSWIKLLTKPLFTSLEVLLKKGKINQVACINNGLWTTNLYPTLHASQIRELTHYLIDAYPKHTLMFPHLNAGTNQELMQDLVKMGYQLVPTGKVFILNQIHPSRQVEEDLDLLSHTPYQPFGHEEVKEEDFSRMAELYTDLYIKKYSTYNPQYTVAFIKHCYQNGLLLFRGFRDKGKIVGFITFHRFNGMMAVPLFGYDLELSQKEGLYRLLAISAIQWAMENHHIFNMGAGAEEFKRLRGAVGMIEYNAVYHRHLPYLQRMPWNTLNLLMKGIGIPILNHFKF